MTHEEAFKALVEKLTEAGFKVDVNGSFIRCVNGHLMTISAQEERPRGYRNPSDGRKVRITIGGYREKSQFPQLKTGEFSWDKIVSEVTSRVNIEDRRADNAVKAKIALEAVSIEVDQLKHQFGLQDYDGKVVINAYSTGIEFKVAKQLTKAQAEILLEAAKKAGLL